MGTLALPMLSKKSALARKLGQTRREILGQKPEPATNIVSSIHHPALKERGLERGVEHKHGAAISGSAAEATAQAALALVQRCLQGDPQAWQLLVQAQHRRIYGICYRFTGCAADAEDLTQDVFLKVYRNLEQFHAERGSFQTWITSLTRNLLVDHFRRSRLERGTSSLDAGWDGVSTTSSEQNPQTPMDRLQDARPGPHEQSVNRQLQAMVQHALTQVSPELREAVILRDLKDMDYKEIALTLNIPEGTVKSRISRGRMELARLLERSKGQGV